MIFENHYKSFQQTVGCGLLRLDSRVGAVSLLTSDTKWPFIIGCTVVHGTCKQNTTSSLRLTRMYHGGVCKQSFEEVINAQSTFWHESNLIICTKYFGLYSAGEPWR